MSPAIQSLVVGLGAAVGANLRFWIGNAARAGIQPWPWPTLLINVVGSVALGAFAALALSRGWSEGWRVLVAVGLCGGFTTFSAFSWETVDLMMRGEFPRAASYVAASVVLSVGGCWLGAHTARVLLTR